MTLASDDSNRRLRRTIYAILIALAAGNMIGRLMAVNSVNRGELEQYLVSKKLSDLEKKLRAEGADDATVAARLSEARPRIEESERRQRPFLSANDRSRWLTIRALSEHATFAIDEVMDANIWNSIDMVKHKGRDGLSHLYSSKPPLLSVLLTLEYLAIRALTGWTLTENPYEVARLMLFTVNVLPMMWMIALVARYAERFGRTDWGRIFIVAAASLGTFLTSFAVTLNNHLIAAVSAAVAFDAFLRIWFDGERRVRWYAIAGGASAFAAANELPALSLLALMAAALVVWGEQRAWLLGFLPAAAAVIAASFGANYAAHGTLSPPYAHRSATNAEDNWYAYTYNLGGKERSSYWLDPQGIDRGEPGVATYAFHVLIGHHGIFSLTPVWLLTAWGIGVWLWRGSPGEKQVAAGIALLSLTCLVFYIGLRPQSDRNYGGMTSGFRWMFWLAPLWLAAMAPAVDRLARSRIGMAAGLVLLTFSVLSASYPTWNPWTQPWIFNWLRASGWEPAFGLIAGR